MRRWRSASTSWWASPACSTSATSPSSASAPTSTRFFASPHFGLHLPFLAGAADRGRRHRAVRHPHRRADAAPARRLSRDRDAGLRRDHLSPAAQPRPAGRTSPTDRAASSTSTRRRCSGHVREQQHAVLLSCSWRCSRSALLLSRAAAHSRVGWAWQAIREDELAARAMGINTTVAKLQAFADRRVVRRRSRVHCSRPGSARCSRTTSCSPSRSTCWPW